MTPDITALAGTVIVPVPLRPTDYELDMANLAHAEFVTANCFVRKAALDRIGGFDERFKRAWREDSDLQFSLLEAGGRIARSTTAKVVHPVRPAHWGICVFQQGKSQYDALLFNKHRRLYASHVGKIPPMHYYLIAFGFLVGVTGLLLDFLISGVVGFAIWIGGGMGFAAYRLRKTTWRASHVAEMIFTSLLIPFLSIFWRWVGALKFGVTSTPLHHSPLSTIRQPALPVS